MTNWKVAPSYSNSSIEKVNEKEKKAYIKMECPRCSGLGIIVSRVENGHIVPIPVDGGVCYQCNGKKVIHKWVKVYTEKEYDRYIANQTKAKERKQAKWEAKMAKLEADSEINKKETLAKMGFDVENPMIYVIIGGNTYNVKEEIKERGGRYNATFGWHYTSNNEPPHGFTTIAIPIDSVYEWFPRIKKFMLKDTAKVVVEEAKKTALPPSKSEYIGEEKERMRDLIVTLTDARPVESRFGTSILFTLKQG